MLPLAVVIGVVLWSDPAGAIRWNFDDGTTQGWAAKTGSGGGLTMDFKLYPGEVADGVWKIDISSSGSVEVISSFIGYDSHLFDRVRVRFRSVHHSPTVGGFLLTWTNEHNSTTPGTDPEGSYKARFLASGQSGFVYTTEWQEEEIVLPTSDDETEKIWEGMLQDIRLRFSVGYENEVEFFEIDWIELTGVEERLQGELPPPHVDYFRFEGTGRFAPPVFHPITPKLGYWTRYHDLGVLTDLDADGDLDLFSNWTKGVFDPIEGWVMALNDGTGAFKTVRSEVLEQGISGMFAGDMTGDGQDEIALSMYSSFAVWSIGSDFEIEEHTQRRGTLIGMADSDDDGDVELFAGRRSADDEIFLEVWDVENGVWTASQVKAGSEHHWSSQVGDFTGDGKLDALWTPRISGGENTLLVAPLGDAPNLQRDAVFAFDYWVRLPQSDLYDNNVIAGDFDGDGQADLITSLRLTLEGRRGLVLRRSQQDGGTQAQVLYDDRLFVRSLVLVHDLDADGVDDWVFVGGDRASGVGVFVAWGGAAGIPHQVETHRLAGDGVEVLPGDVDGDGDLDLVVLDHLFDGVHVLKSLGGAQPTAVQTTAAAQPARHRLGHSYPNPFNPRVVIPLDLATAAAEVSLRVYDVLGRRVRQLWQGPLGAGEHRFVWDGRDAAGKAVAAGVYVYQVAVDGQIAANKTTKLP